MSQPMPDTPSNTEEGKKSVSVPEIKEKFGKAERSTLVPRRDYWLNQSFLDGNQWLYYDNTTNRLSQVPRDPRRPRVTINRIADSMRILMAKTLQRSLRFEGRPTAADDVSIQGAKLGEQIIMAYVADQMWDEKNEELVQKAFAGGTSALAVDWCPDGQSPDSPAGEGYAEVTPLSIAEIYCEPGSKNLHTARWWIKAQALPTAEVQAKYKMKNRPESDGNSAVVSYGPNFKVLDNGQQMDTDLTIVYTYYERPNFLRPEGAIAVVVGDAFVWGPSPWPFKFRDCLNIVPLMDNGSTGRWWGRSSITDAREPQVNLNYTHSVLNEHLKKVGYAKPILPASQAQLSESWDDDPGHPLITLPHEEKPSYMMPPQIPAWITNLIQTYETAIDDALNVHAISRGTPTGGVESGYGLELLAENDSTPVGLMIKNLTRCWSTVGGLVLQLLEQNVVTTHKTTIPMAGGAAHSIQWTGESLHGQTRVTVPLDSLMPRSRSQMLQFAKESVSMGMVPPGNFAMFAKLADLPDLDNLMSVVDSDTSAAQWTLGKLAEGEMLMPQTFVDPKKYISVINSFRKTPTYYYMDENDKAVIDAFVQSCETLAAENAGMQVARDMMHPALGAIPTADGANVQDPSALGKLMPPPVASPPTV